MVPLEMFKGGNIPIRTSALGQAGGDPPFAAAPLASRRIYSTALRHWLDCLAVPDPPQSGQSFKRRIPSHASRVAEDENLAREAPPRSPHRQTQSPVRTDYGRHRSGCAVIVESRTLFQGVFSFNFGFSAAVEDLR